MRRFFIALARAFSTSTRTCRRIIPMCRVCDGRGVVMSSTVYLWSCPTCEGTGYL